ASAPSTVSTERSRKVTAKVGMPRRYGAPPVGHEGGNPVNFLLPRLWTVDMPSSGDGGPAGRPGRRPARLHVPALRRGGHRGLLRPLSGLPGHPAGDARWRRAHRGRRGLHAQGERDAERRGAQGRLADAPAADDVRSVTNVTWPRAMVAARNCIPNRLAAVSYRDLGLDGLGGCQRATPRVGHVCRRWVLSGSSGRGQAPHIETNGADVVRRIPIRAKVAGALAVPLLALVVAAGIGVSANGAQAAEVARQAELATASIGHAGLLSALQNERNQAMIQMLGLSGRLTLEVDDGGDARARTDAAHTALHQQIAGQGDRLREDYAAALDSLDSLAARR